MTCASCALKIENRLRDLDGVNSSVVNFANEEATVEYNSKTTDYSNFNQAIKDLGYKASLSKIDISSSCALYEFPRYCISSNKNISRLLYLFLNLSYLFFFTEYPKSETKLFELTRPTFIFLSFSRILLPIEFKRCVFPWLNSL